VEILQCTSSFHFKLDKDIQEITVTFPLKFSIFNKSIIFAKLLYPSELALLGNFHSILHGNFSLIIFETITKPENSFLTRSLSDLKQAAKRA